MENLKNNKLGIIVLDQKLNNCINITNFTYKYLQKVAFPF